MAIEKELEVYVREVVFGLEDSFVSTMGTLSGVAVGSGDRQAVLLAGIVVVVVEALSMAAGSYLSSKSANELYEDRLRRDGIRILDERLSDKESLRDFFLRKGFSKKEVALVLKTMVKERALWLDEVARSSYETAPALHENPLRAASIMGAFYLLGGFLVLLPYVLLPLAYALPVTLLFTAGLLFILGVWKARISGTRALSSGLEMVIVAFSAGVIGMIVGRLYVGVSLL